ncbi:MAG: TonB-dependent receptor, partial [Bacteroidota bacterium]
PSWRGKLEVYYQDISNAAVEAFPSSYSSLTEGSDFEFDNDRVSLVNEGTGFNQGIELTLEKFFSKGYYGLFTASIFESKYEGSDRVERNSPFNNGYVLNFLTGREFTIGSSGRTKLFFDTRAAFAGGRYFTPIDLEASQQAGFEVLQEDLAFSEQYDDYFRWDVKFGIKLNSRGKKRSHQFYLDLQNVTNRDNVFVQRYNRLTNQVNQVDQVGFFPDFGYKFQF